MQHLEAGVALEQASNRSPATLKPNTESGVLYVSVACLFQLSKDNCNTSAQLIIVADAILSCIRSISYYSSLRNMGPEYW